MIPVTHKSLSSFKFIDLFAGLGGFRLALESYGAKCVYSSEWDTSAQKVYLENFGEVPDGDITKVDELTIPDHDILCGGFPCQAFSISGKRHGFEDSRGTLFFDIARIVKAKRPKVVFLENVKNFASHDNGNTLRVVRETLQSLGYSVYHKVLNPVNFGIPQKRERIYIVCFRNDINSSDFKFPAEFPLTKFVEDYLLDDSHPDVSSMYCSRKDLYLTDKAITSNSNKAIRVGYVNKGGQGERIYSPKGIAITLSAYGGGVFSKTGGYLINGRVRKLHPRECARVMGYPDSYILSKSNAQAYKQFGNSVVVDVLQAIAFEIGIVLNC